MVIANGKQSSEMIKILFLSQFGSFEWFHCFNKPKGVGWSNRVQTHLLHIFEAVEESRHGGIKSLEFEKIEKCDRRPANIISDRLIQLANC